MKGAYLISASADLYAKFEALLVRAGGTTAKNRVAQLRTNGAIELTVFGDVDPTSEPELTDQPTAIRGNSVPPNPTTAAACWVECSSERTFVHWVQELAGKLDAPVWVLDGNGVLWASEALNTELLQL